MNFRYIALIMLVLTLSACSSAAQKPLSTESPQPTVKPTFTQLPITFTPEPESTPSFTPTIDTPATETLVTGSVNQTVLNFKFPFEPTIGYIVDIKSKALTTNLMCALGGESTGEVIEMSDNSTESKKWGNCDKSSMTLNISIPDQMTVTVILGGMPFINEETKSPSQITAEQIQYNFEVNLE